MRDEDLATMAVALEAEAVRTKGLEAARTKNAVLVARAKALLELARCTTSSELEVARGKLRKLVISPEESDEDVAIIGAAYALADDAKPDGTFGNLRDKDREIMAAFRALFLVLEEHGYSYAVSGLGKITYEKPVEGAVPRPDPFFLLVCR